MCGIVYGGSCVTMKSVSTYIHACYYGVNSLRKEALLVLPTTPTLTVLRAFFSFIDTRLPELCNDIVILIIHNYTVMFYNVVDTILVMVL